MAAGDFVPSPGLETGEAALERLLPGSRSVRVAVAFVTASGVALLTNLLEQHGIDDVEVVARGAPVTDPEALLALRDEHRVRVSVVAGEEAVRFHPKLWLLRDESGLDVLAGSGNLTAGGMRDNREQFELIRASTTDEIEAQEQRFESLTSGAFPLKQVEKSIAWQEWRRLARERGRLERELERLDDKIAQSPVGDGREADQLALLDDLDLIYDRTVAANIPRSDGQQYFPTRFKQGIDRARESSNPVRLVFNMCRHQTKGFDVILEADMPMLTVEALVVDESKSYHDLFQPETKRLSAERLRQFPSWPPDDPSS
jgi:HKD family nuclease